MKRQNRFGLKAVVAAISLQCQACATSLWPFGGSEHKDTEDLENAAEPPDTKKPGKSAAKDTGTEDIELKQARMWNRLDDLEEQVRVQKEQIKLLEQGLLTGIPPEALRAKPRSKPHSKPKEPGELATKQVGRDENGLSSPVLDLPDQLSSAAEAQTSASSPDSIKVRLQVAKDYYQSSRFGMAIAELAQIQKAFGAKAADGEAQYYLGRSYLGIKEYITARTELETFLKMFPTSPFRGMARLELARAYSGLNLRDRARKELSSIAKDFEGQEEGDMAAGELRVMKGSL